MLTAEKLKAMHVPETLLEALTETFEKFDINTPERQAAFIGQCSHESANFTKAQENLNYKDAALMALFGRHRISEADCHKYGRNDATGQKADQDAIANHIYGGEFGLKNLGNTQEGDGARFKGRGYIQLTGRANYAKAGEALGVDLCADPNLVATPRYAMLTAGWFWKTHGCNEAADTLDAKLVTKKVNGGDLGLADRIAHTQQALDVLVA